MACWIRLIDHSLLIPGMIHGRCFISVPESLKKRAMSLECATYVDKN